MQISQSSQDNSFIVAIAHCLAWGKDIKTNKIVTELQKDLPPLRTLNTASAVSQWLNSHGEYWQSDIGLVYGGATKIKSYLFESIDLQEIRGASALLDRINLVDLPALFHAERSKQFPHCQKAQAYCEAVRQDLFNQNKKQNKEQFSALQDALIPELIIYSTGGNILAFCPAELADGLANAIEKRYTTETLTANACAVATTFKAAEIYLGLLQDPVSETIWLDTLKDQELVSLNPMVRAYFGVDKDASEKTVKDKFFQRKGFSELTAKLASQFNQRRSGDEKGSTRYSRGYPPMFETHPYLMRDDSDRRSLVLNMAPEAVRKNNPEFSDKKLTPDEILPDEPKLSEASARKRWVGQVTKRENSRWRAWYRKTEFIEHWNPIQVLDDELEELGIELKTEEELKQKENLFKVGLSSWVNRFEQFLLENEMIDLYDHFGRKIFADEQPDPDNSERPNIQNYYTREARSLNEIGDASNGFVAYIYADGNNMGAYIREKLKTPDDYRQFSEDVFEATEQSVYWAIAHHVHPHYYQPDAKFPRDNKSSVYIHPFEIITIGGDDVLLIVPANRALEVAKAIGERFEELLMQKRNEDGNKRYKLDQTILQKAQPCHRYKGQSVIPSQCRLSMSSGVLITAANTPIYYADRLVSQLLKSAKKKAKDLREIHHYGGTVDILTLKAVTMISSDINAFRKEGLTVRFPDRNQHLKLYATPYTLHELGGLIDTVGAIKTANFPRSQLYQIRSLLERGKRTAILNYRYFRVRLKEEEQALLIRYLETSWCKAVSNDGNLAPWMPDIDTLYKNLSLLLLIEMLPGENFFLKCRFFKFLSGYTYTTIWRELVELYPFIDLDNSPLPPETNNSQNNPHPTPTETPKTPGEVQA